MPSRRHLLRSTAVTALVLAAPFPAAADLKSDGQKLVQSMADQVISILANASATRADREARFLSLFRQHFDTVTIGAWVLGRPWQTANAQQRRDYIAVFENYIAKVYAGQLSQYRGEKLRVSGVEDDGEGVSVVSHINDTAGNRTIEIKWRLRGAGAQLKVRDVVIENISMSLNQRREFASVLQQRDGTVDGLIAALREKIAELDARK